MAKGPPGPWSIEPAPADQGDGRTPYERLYLDEFGPLLAGWVRLGCGSRAEFWSCEAWEIGAALQVGAYAPPPDDAPAGRPAGGPGTTPQGRRRVPSRRASGPSHPRSQRELLEARQAHAADPERNPAPQPIGPGMQGPLFALMDPDAGTFSL